MQPDASGAQPSFLEAFTAAQQAPTPEPTTQPTPATEPTPTPAAPATPAATGTGAATPAADADAWLKDLPGAFKSKDELTQTLSGLEQLRANQLTDDQRAVLKLSEDPEVFREFNQLTHIDYKTLSDEQALFEGFKKNYPGMEDDSLRVLFEQEQDAKYPGLANAPEDAAYKAAAAKQKFDANRERTSLDQARTARLADLKKGALPAAGPTPEQEQADRAKYLEGIDKLLDSHKDGYKMTVKIGDADLNLSVEPKDIPAFKEVVANPLAALLSEDKKSLDPQKLMRFAAFMMKGDALLTDAYTAGKSGNGPAISVAELHNAEGEARPPAQGGDGSFASALQKATGQQTQRPKY